jgi:glutamyl/glutaminyl-tRNA synthetase
MNPSIVTRFAPSPTGNLHSGAYRTAIFAYLYARKNGGKFVLRIEDTDKERSKKEYEENILESLKWLGLEYDVFVTQSENVGRHKDVLEKMIAEGHAYVSKEEAKDGSGVIKEIIRFKNPNLDVSFQDEFKGKVTMNTKDLGDFVIAKNSDEPLFHLAVVVDDFDAGVTHVIRGEDHVSNTPRQILIQRAIGAPTPTYAHLPLVLGIDKQKLSKRKGALAVTEYRDLGYLPEALLNMVAMVGWNPGTEQEEQKSGVEKFLPEKFHTVIDKILPIIIERINYFGEVVTMVEAGEFDYYIDRPTVDLEKVSWKGEGNDQAKIHLTESLTLLENVSEELWNKEGIKDAVWAYAESVGRGNVLWPIRFSLSGRDKSPDPFALAEILGKKETLVRLTLICEKLS